jgi:hypothetical protein
MNAAQDSVALSPVVPLTRPDDAITVEASDRPSIPEGKYEAVFLRHETAYSFGKAPKVYVWFRITSNGTAHGMELYKPYNVKAIKGKPRRGGGLVVGRHHALLADLARLLHLKLRPDRLSPNELKTHVFEISVRTVRKNYRQEYLPDFLQYSVIDRIERVAT